MPYIRIDHRIHAITKRPSTAGELNYSIHKLIHAYLEHEKPGYEAYNKVLGVLEAVKQEFYRRKVAPYEDKKIKENGDIALYENG